MWLLLLGFGCDRSYAPCAAVDDATVTIFPDCPDHAEALVSSLSVTDADLAVVWAAGAEERAELAAIVYAELPPGWTESTPPAELISGAEYGVNLFYFDAPAGATTFVAP